MDKKVFTATLILLLIPAFSLRTETTVLYIDLPTTVALVGDTFSVNITISDVTDLAGWEFKLYYLSSTLNGTNLEEGPFLRQGGSTYFDIINFTDNYNSTHGIAWATCALLGAGLGVNGNGTLAVVTFKAKQLGTSSLSFADTLLSDSQLDPQPIPHTALDGTVYVLHHDVAILTLTPSKTIVGEGLTAKIYVNVFNEGNFTEKFNVTVYANTSIMGTHANITLTSGNFTTITFTWNASGFVKGNYTIWAYAWLVSPEADTDDNTCVDSVVTIVFPGDVNADGIVETKDVAAICRAYGKTPSDPGWNPNLDLNDDGILDTRDVAIACRNYGKTDP